MNIHDATEQAYKNGYEAGLKAARKHACNDNEVKQVILSKIIKADYRNVMNCVIDGYSHKKTAEMCGYCKRQVERIVTLCWREVCILLAEDVANRNETE